MDDPWLGYTWDFYGWPGYVDYPEECDEAVKEDSAARRPVRFVPAESAASSPARTALSRLLLKIRARFRGTRSERPARAGAHGQELSLGADRP
jgi:hypothetical protein